MNMVIFTNNKGQGFPYIDDVGENRVMLITPLGEFKTLERNIFVEQVEGYASDFLSIDVVKRMQVERYREKLLSMGAEAKELEERKATREGHTDSDGSDAHNLSLSLNRALSVRSYLVGSFAVNLLYYADQCLSRTFTDSESLLGFVNEVGGPCSVSGVSLKNNGGGYV